MANKKIEKMEVASIEPITKREQFTENPFFLIEFDNLDEWEEWVRRDDPDEDFESGVSVSAGNDILSTDTRLRILKMVLRGIEKSL